MFTTVTLRRVAAASSSSSRIIALRTARQQHVRSASTSMNEEEVDPQLNGYPQLPFVSRQTLTPYGWQDPLMRRNFGDTIHEEDEVLSMWGPDVSPLPPATAARHFLIAVSAFVGFGLTVKYILLQDPPAVRREYPFSGLITELGGLQENKARTRSTDED